LWALDGAEGIYASWIGWELYNHPNHGVTTSGSAMSSHRVATALLVVGALLLLGGGGWLITGERPGKGTAILSAGVGFALICFSQAVRRFAKRQSQTPAERREPEQWFPTLSSLGLRDLVAYLRYSSGAVI
jgi:hypothetical protein